MQEITTQNKNEMAVYDPKLINTLKNSLYPGASTESVCLVIDYCRVTELDIMLKPVHIVPMSVKDGKTGKYEYRDVIMPGINLYRIQASRSGCAGISEPEFGEDIIEGLGGIDITYPKWCKITVKRIIAGQIVEFSAKEFWKENYATAGKDKPTQPNSMWKKRPYGQLAKCTEAQALRKAFPEVGAMPTAEEMEGKHLDAHEFEEIKKHKPNKGIKGLEARLGIEQEAEFEEVIDIETGEIEEIETAQPEITLSTIKFLMESASNIKELIEAADQARNLPDEDKVTARTIYKQVEKKLNEK